MVAAEALAAANNSPGPVAITGALFRQWINYVDVKPKSLDTYTKCIRQFMSWLKAANINKPTRDDILEYREYLRATKKPTTVQVYITAVKLFFRWAEQQGLYPNIADHIKGAKIDSTHKKDYLTSNQIKKVLSAIDKTSLKGSRDYAIIALMTTTGLRTIEVARANIEDIRAVGDSLVLFIQGKGHDEKSDYVKLAEPVEEAIRKYLQKRGSPPGAAALFGAAGNHNHNGRMTTRSISRIVKAALMAAGLNSTRLTAHSLRHTAATLNLLNGATIEETKQLLRHSSINTTLIYSHALERAKNNSESRIAKAIF